MFKNKCALIYFFYNLNYFLGCLFTQDGLFQISFSEEIGEEQKIRGVHAEC